MLLPVTLPLRGQAGVLTTVGASKEGGEGAVATELRGHVGNIRLIRTEGHTRAETATGDTGAVLALELGHRVAGGGGRQGEQGEEEEQHGAATQL